MANGLVSLWKAHLRVFNSANLSDRKFWAYKIYECGATTAGTVVPNVPKYFRIVVYISALPFFINNM